MIMIKKIMLCLVIAGLFGCAKDPMPIEKCQTEFVLRPTKSYKQLPPATELDKYSREETLKVGQSIFDSFVKYLNKDWTKEDQNTPMFYPIESLTSAQKSNIEKTFDSESGKIFLAQQWFVANGSKKMVGAPESGLGKHEILTLFNWLTGRKSKAEELFLGSPPKICPEQGA